MEKIRHAAKRVHGAACDRVVRMSEAQRWASMTRFARADVRRIILALMESLDTIALGDPKTLMSYFAVASRIARYSDGDLDSAVVTDGFA